MMNLKSPLLHLAFPLMIKASLAEWHCGAGPVTGMCAAIATATCDHANIDKCCWIHDRCYEKLHLNQTYCDDEFCNCLNSIPGNMYCQTLVHELWDNLVYHTK
uniref:Phospholipase A2 n=1 Tax=Acrobeloides nanus TaxID=290746 RepID=A0A914CRB3_9BILA